MMEMNTALTPVSSRDVVVAGLLRHLLALLVSLTARDFPRVEEPVKINALAAEVLRQHLVVERWQIRESAFVEPGRVNWEIATDAGRMNSGH
jgi:hypothetical protein